MSRRKIVKRIKESDRYTNADLSLLEIVTIGKLVKSQKTVYKRIRDAIKDILVGTIKPSFSKKTSCYYGVKSFLKFEDEEGALPCFIARDCMMPDFIGVTVIILEWNFIWIGKRNGLNIAYLDIIQILPLRDTLIQPIGRLVNCLYVKESFRLASVVTKKSSPILTSLVGKVCGVSEVCRTSDGNENFIVWLEDLEDPKIFVFVSVNLPNLLWIQSWLQHEDTYIFENVSLELLHSDGKPVIYFMASDKFHVELYNSVRVSTDFISSEDVLRSNNMNMHIDQEINSCHINRRPKGLTTISGIVTEARYSHFGKFILNERIRVYLHMSGGGNFEHVRAGSEVRLENVYSFNNNLIIGGPLSRVVVVSLECEVASIDESLFDDSQQVECTSHVDDHLSDQDFKPWRILAELLENCSVMSSKQLDGLIQCVSYPQKQFCPELLSSINFKTYKDMFTSSVCKMMDTNVIGAARMRFVNPGLPLTLVRCFDTMKKIENCMFEKHDKMTGDDCLLSGSKTSKIITIQELHDIPLKDERFKLFERVQDYWECNILTSNSSEENLHLFGILKLDDRRACLSLVDSNDFMECVVTDVNDSLGVHSCFRSKDCKLSFELSETISQSVRCPRVQPAHVNCLIRVDNFVLVSEKFKLRASKTMGDEADDVYEKRYLVFSASDVVLFGPHMLMELGVTYFPSWPTPEDIERFEAGDFSSSEWTHFSYQIAKHKPNRFSYECFILKNLFQECNNHSFEGFEKQATNQHHCTCKLSFTFVVKTKDGPIMRTKNPNDDFDALEALESYLKDFESCISTEGPPEMSSVNSTSQPHHDHVQNWKSIDKIAPDTANIRNIKFFASKNFYQFGMTVFIVDFKNVVCDRCLSTRRISKRDPRFREIFGISEFHDHFEEVFMLFSEKSSGWYPTFHAGCVYEIELTGDQCTPVRQQFKTSANKLPSFIKRRKVEMFGWKYVIEISECKKINIKRSYRDWFGSTYQHLPHLADDSIKIVDNVKSVLGNISKHLTFQREGRINLDGKFETLVGIVTMKRFNLPKCSSENFQQHPEESKTDLHFSSGNSIPGSRDVVVTLQLLGSEEIVKVFIPNNKAFKYVLGVLLGSCICFSRVVKANPCDKYKNSALYTFLSSSNLEVLRFPSDPFASVDRSSLGRFTFNDREIHAETNAMHEQGGGDEGAQSLSMFNNSANLFEYSEIQRSPRNDHARFVDDKHPPSKSLRGLLYQNNTDVSSNVLIKDILKIELYYSCARHPDNQQTFSADTLCCVCNSPLTLFRAKLKADFSDSTFRSRVVCHDEFAKKILNLTEQSWKELAELVAICPKKNVCYEKDKNNVQGDGLASDVAHFLCLLANSERVQRRLFVKGNRFRTVIDRSGLKSFDLRFGPRPLDFEAPLATSNLGLQERLNACYNFVCSAVNDANQFSLPVVNFELTDVTGAGN